MINKDAFLDIALEKALKLDQGQSLEIYPFKRDRKVAITKVANGYLVYEKGFLEEDHGLIAPEKLKKCLKTIGKREFPRSHKLHLKIRP